MGSCDGDVGPALLSTVASVPLRLLQSGGRQLQEQGARTDMETGPETQVSPGGHTHSSTPPKMMDFILAI